MKIQNRRNKNLVVVSVQIKDKKQIKEVKREIRKTILKWNRLYGKFDYEIIIR